MESMSASKPDTVLLSCSSYVGFAVVFIAFQAVLHASAEQTTTRYAGARQRLYQKISHLGTMRMFRPYCKKKGDFYGESI